MRTGQRALQCYARVDSITRTEQASPHRLIELLYAELLACLRQAGIAITNGDLEMKSGRLSKALSIGHGLESGLDFTRGGEVARTLGDVYASVRRKAIAAGSDMDPAGLAEGADATEGSADAWTRNRPCATSTRKGVREGTDVDERVSRGD